MKWFITGGSGQIGGWLIRRLLEAGDEVCNFDLTDKGTFSWHGIPSDLTVIGSIMEPETLAAALNAFRPDVVVHLAAQSGVEAARASGSESVRLNILGTLNVLETCQGLGFRNVVAASSNHVYGTQDTRVGRTPETAALHQRDLYSTTKIASDIITQAWAHNYGLNAIAVRNTNAYGPYSPHDDHLVEGTILSLLRGKPPVIRSDGCVAKSYIYLQDVADAYITIGRKAAKTKLPPAVNVIGCRPINAREMVALITDIMGFDCSPVVLGQPNDQSSEDLDDTLMRSEFQWEPSVRLEAGLGRTIRWFRDCRQ